MNFLTQMSCKDNKRASYFRICLGSKDSDTSFAISRMLYLLLKKNSIPVDYHIIWGLGHCDADYQEKFGLWVDSIVEKGASYNG